MCGIVGFAAPGQDPAAAKQIVRSMADLIRHRGPDGEGCYADGTAALGHRRSLRQRPRSHAPRPADCGPALPGTAARHSGPA